MQNNGYLWGIVIGVALIVLGYFIFDVHKASAPGPSASSTGQGTTTVSLGNGVTATLPPGVKLTETDTTASSGSGIKPPSLLGPILATSTLPADAQAVLKSDEQTLITQLTASPTRLDLWLQLGVDRKIGGDYTGAIAAWDYVAAAGPSSISYIAYGNLGDLYQNFDINYPKAEADYKAAIAINPQVPDYYVDLYNLYRYDDSNIAAANAIVVAGLKANPNDNQLTALQQQ